MERCIGCSYDLGFCYIKIHKKINDCPCCYCLIKSLCFGDKEKECSDRIMLCNRISDSFMKNITKLLKGVE